MYTAHQLTLTSFLLILLYFSVIVLIFRQISGYIYKEDSLIRKLFCLGLVTKLAAGLLYGGIYEFIYHFEGDTFYYFRSSNYLASVLFQNPAAYLKVITGTYEQVTSDYFNGLNYNPYFSKDAVFVHTHSFLSFFALFSLQNYYLQTLVMNAFLYIIQWQFFKMLKELFPNHIKAIAVSILFIPSVLFWGAGLMKDPFTLTFSQLIVVCFYKMFFKYKFRFKYILGFIIVVYVVLSLKHYILYTRVISCIVWRSVDLIKMVKGAFVRLFVLPFVLVMMVVVSVFVMQYLTLSAGGAYGSMDAMMKKAAFASEDLQNER